MIVRRDRPGRVVGAVCRNLAAAARQFPADRIGHVLVGLEQSRKTAGIHREGGHPSGDRYFLVKGTLRIRPDTQLLGREAPQDMEHRPHMGGSPPFTFAQVQSKHRSRFAVGLSQRSQGRYPIADKRLSRVAHFSRCEIRAAAQSGR